MPPRSAEGKGVNVTILVTGATGTVGRNVVDQLIRAGQRVRALTRDPALAALPADVEVVEGDLIRPETLPAALAGVERVFLFPVAETARQFADLAKRAGVWRIVVLSSAAVDEGGDNSIGRYHRAVERAVEDAGVEWTHVRPGPFMANVLWQWGPAIASEGVVRAPYADAAQAPVHEADIAAVATAALLQDGHAGRAYTLTGPESITQLEQAHAIGKAIGRDVAFEELTPQQAYEYWAGMGIPPDVVEALLGFLPATVGRAAPVLPTVVEVTGRPARWFAEWAADHAADFE
jgi:uncharacterized protein YbjT (DUF2867 family)